MQSQTVKSPKNRKGVIQLRFLLSLAVMMIILAVALSFVIATRYRASMEDYYSTLAFNEAKIAAMNIDGDRIRDYYSDGETGEKDDYYEQVRQYLLGVKKTVGLKYFYIIVPDEDGVTYIWDAGEEGEEGVCELGDTEVYYGDGKEVELGAFRDPNGEGRILITNDTSLYGYGYLASAYVAILDSEGVPVALSSVDISMDRINDEIRSFILTLGAVIIAVLIICSLGTFIFIKFSIIRPIDKLSRAASSIVSDNMDRLADFNTGVKKNGDEIGQLAQSFEFMAHELHSYIKNLSSVTAEKERIGAELGVATKIQASMLPCIFPPFPNRHEFDIYATMNPAKEVGGDFYDFFLTDPDHLAVVIADVSGKGVPAALFMVIAKTLIKNYALVGHTPAEVFTLANAQLCEGNEAEMFVTGWMGILEISSGKFSFVNAGHNPPIIRRADGGCEYLRSRPGFVLAGMEDIHYRQVDTELHDGDCLYLYTDGVTEATNSANELYGEERLMAVVNSHSDVSPSELLPAVKADIDAFVGTAPQFDDITMLGLRVKNAGNAASPLVLRVAANDDELDHVLGFIEEHLDEHDFGVKEKMQIAVAAEELFVNIAHYAYTPETGDAEIGLLWNETDGSVAISFTDSGVPYDPLAKDDPDITLSAEERKIGGLGIFMVKKTMDDMRYEYRDGRNITTIIKRKQQ